ncbi:MAG TPA: GTPase [Archangium sp.]|nr:GTPase [Archangium sp.]
MSVTRHAEPLGPPRALTSLGGHHGLGLGAYVAREVLRVPDPLARDIRQKIAHLRALLLEQRLPNLILVGRRGAGKSSLINAFFGAHVAEVGHVKAQTGQGRCAAQLRPHHHARRDPARQYLHRGPLQALPTQAAPLGSGVEHLFPRRTVPA